MEPALAVAYIPVQLIEIPAALTLARRVLGVRPADLWRALRTPILATLVMSVGVIACEMLGLVVLRAGDTATLGLCLAVGVSAYTIALLVLNRDILRETREVLLTGL